MGKDITMRGVMNGSWRRQHSIKVRCISALGDLGFRLTGGERVVKPVDSFTATEDAELYSIEDEGQIDARE